ncbi:MAG TPA: magnesium transporter CorA family protein [Candidatus Paceibacterota bacterium]|jgi:magnesium transporter|nr:magnesium transporter CorA family protein [Candidatus Paceibacterota bacterium]
MINKHAFNGSTWIELDHPTIEEVRTVMDEYAIHPKIARELVSPSLRQRLEGYEDHLYLILHFPAFRHTHKEENVQEIDFVIGRNYVITVKYDTVDSLHKFSKVVEVDSILRRSAQYDDPAYIFFGILHEIYRSLLEEIAYLEDWTEDIERNIFKEKEREMVFTLSHVGRNLLDLKKIVEQHKELLDDLEEQGGAAFGEKFMAAARDLKADFFKVRALIRGNLEMVQELRETNNSLVTTKQNDAMKTLTLLAFVTYPLSLLAAVFGMNTTGMPLVGNPYDFWVIVGVMLAAAACMFVYFKRKRWL